MVQVEPEGSIVHHTFHINDSDLILCAYGPPTRKAARTGPEGKTTNQRNVGVLVVDARDGSIKATVPFPPLSSSSSSHREEAILWMTAWRCDAGAGDRDQTAVACVTSAGGLWRFCLNTAHVTIGEPVYSDVLLKGLASEASPMEDLILEMEMGGLHVRPDQSGTEGKTEDGASAANVSTKHATGSDTGRLNSSSEKCAELPAFICENGYRGIRSGYTYWDGTMGTDGTVRRGGDDIGEHHRAGYYRNDVMRDILKAQRARELGQQDTPCPDGAADVNQRVVDCSEAKSHAGTRKLLRCFLYLPKASKFVTCAHHPEDGMLTTGDINLGLPGPMVDGEADNADHTRDVEVMEDVKEVKDGSKMSGGDPRTASMSIQSGIDAPCTVSNLDGLVGHLSGVLTLAASPDEKYVASGSYDQTIRVYETATWSCIKVLKGHGGGIKCLSFSDDGTQLLSAASDNTTRVWSTKTWMCMRQLHGRHEDATWPVRQAYVTHGAEKLLVSGSNGFFGGSTLKIFDVTSGDCLATFAQLRFDHKGSCSALGMVRKEGQALRVVTAATDASLAGWDCDVSCEIKKPLLAKGFLC